MPDSEVVAARQSSAASDGALDVAIAPQTPGLADPMREAVESAGGRVVEPHAARALLWNFDSADRLAATLAGAPAITWVQLPAAGVENYRSLFGDGRLWTSAKGAYAEPVAEHALALMLAGLRELPRRARAHAWEAKGGRTLFDSRVTLIGAGGIGRALVDLLRPFRVHVTVVRKHPEPVPGATTVLPVDRLREGVRGAGVVVLAAALTDDSEAMIGEAELAAMGSDCWLVNVARGRLVDTQALVTALGAGTIAGAALDVTDPEPLPEGHPLWHFENCLITPHTANPAETERDHLVRHIAGNVRARIAGTQLAGIVDPTLGY
ncbi:MAG: D-isomer specific 2-hydroxyacid dehydrogenase family protein [Candidatus Dormibacteraeota bacterium]|nr:D-isomer specific 2-hydroxyacid dehydrogenase family protein [Candidatus Dormibacteraeota bacterium]